MSSIVTQPTSTAQWQCLVQEAAQVRECPLEDDLESYLVFLLIRFTSQPEIVETLFATDYLASMARLGRQRTEQLRDVGDKCLLFSGLFPRRAQRKRVNVGYFVSMGQSAYGQIADSLKQETATTYTRLAERFVGLMDVLQTMRELHQHTAENAVELLQQWQQCGSQRALNLLQEKYNIVPFASATKTTN